MTSPSLFTTSNPITSYTTPLIMLDAVSISLRFNTNVHRYDKLPMPSKFKSRIADARIFFRENGYATISQEVMNINGKRLSYAEIGQPYPEGRGFHKNLRSEADKRKLIECSKGNPQQYENGLLFKLLDEVESYVFANHTRLQFYSTGEEIETELGLFRTNDIKAKVHYIEYCIEFPFQIRPDIQQWNLAKALSSMYGENKDLHLYKGKDIDLRWTIPIPPELGGTEKIELKGYPKEFEFEDDAASPYKEQVFRVELKFHKPRIDDDKSSPLDYIKRVIETVSSHAAKALTEIYKRSIEPPKLYSYGEVSQRVLASLKRGKNDKRVDTCIQVIADYGVYTRSLVPKSLRLSYNQLGSLVKGGIVRPMKISKQGNSHLYIPLSKEVRHG